jgi:nucleoid-associated protein YgaU
MTVGLLALAAMLAAPAAPAPAAAKAPPAAAAAPHRYDAEALDTLDAMGKAAAATNDYTMRLVKRELFDTKLSPEETIVIKWQRPQRVYLHELVGAYEGQEVLYAPGWNKNRIKVHSGSFPDITLNLDPYGSLAMAHSHHPLPQVSLVQLVDRILDNVRRARAKSVGTLQFEGRDEVLGRQAARLEATMPPTGTTPTIERGQTLWDIAKATGQSMYVILHANRTRQWRQGGHPTPGDAVVVPEYYAGRMVVWVDDELHLPIQVDLYDHEGKLYEHYEHHDLAVNVGLTDADFDPKNRAYKF